MQNGFGIRFSAIVSILLIPIWCHVCGAQQVDSILQSDRGDNRTLYTENERLFEQEKYVQALGNCDRLLDKGIPSRVYNRIQATAIRCCLMLNRPEDAVRRVETIYERDPASPYLSLLPLVWDDRLPSHERYVASPGDLRSESILRQLSSASALLQDSRYTERCVEILKELRSNRHLPVGIIAETQLWRIQLTMTDSVHLPTVRRWQKRAAGLPESLRSGPQFIVGRAFQLRHKPDQAALELLWLPLMQNHDPNLAASGLAEAIVCLEATGRSASAGRLRRELLNRFPRTSAANHIKTFDSSSPSLLSPGE
ncbi:MAG: hypothetical protein MK110_00775 [Fuerstiella sp.]|nr:hypothetical protein [Fuerstiella sp.]